MTIYIVTCLQFQAQTYSHKPADGQRALREAAVEVESKILLAVSACEEVKLRWWVGSH